MPPLATLTRPVLSTPRKVGLTTVLPSYLLLATILTIVKIVQVAVSG